MFRRGNKDLERAEADHQIVLNRYREMLAERDATIREYEERWKSPDGTKVLHDLQDALNLVREYQRAFHLASMRDPVIGRANKLLSSWGMKPYSNTREGFKADDQGEIISRPRLPPLTPAPGETFEQRLAREEDEWGDEAYGKANVEIVAEDMGPDPDAPGYRLGRVKFVEKPESFQEHKGNDDILSKRGDRKFNDTGHGSDGENQ